MDNKRMNLIKWLWYDTAADNFCILSIRNEGHLLFSAAMNEFWICLATAVLYSFCSAGFYQQKLRVSGILNLVKKLIDNETRAADQLKGIRFSKQASVCWTHVNDSRGYYPSLPMLHELTRIYGHNKIPIFEQNIFLSYQLITVICLYCVREWSCVWPICQVSPSHGPPVIIHGLPPGHMVTAPRGQGETQLLIWCHSSNYKCIRELGNQKIVSIYTEY